MSSQEKYLELITAYLKNEMSSEEASSFENELAENEGLQEEFSFQVNLQNILKEKSDADLKQQFNHLEQSLPSIEQADTKPKSKFITLFPRLAIAASVLLLAGFFFLNSNDSAVDLYSNYFSDYPNEIVTIERGDSEIEEGQKAFILYGDKKYSQALQAFENLSLEGLDVYKAICFMHLEDYNKAIALLNKNEEGDLDHSNQRAWYTALCYLKLNEKQKAKLALQKITNGNASFRKTSAKQLLEEIK